MGSCADGLSLEDSLYLYHHIFLPPKLPGEDDDSSKHDSVLLHTVLAALSLFKEYSPGPQAEIVDDLVTMFIRLKESSDACGGIGVTSLMAQLSSLESPGGTLPIYVKAQNAAVLMTRVGDYIHVETFELSPRNEAVMTTIGRLRRSFPAFALKMSRGTFKEPGCIRNIAETLSKMSQQQASGTSHRVRKAGQAHNEERDTTHPKIVTELFMGFMRGMAEDTEVSAITKNTREEVMWSSSKIPWRRSPLWLLVRVALQLVCTRQSAEKEIPHGTDIYKHFIVFFMSYIFGNMKQHALSSEQLYAMNSKIARRLLKLDLPDTPPWLCYIRDVMQKMSDDIDRRWSTIQKLNSSQYDHSALPELKFQDDAPCILTELDDYVQRVENRETAKKKPHDVRTAWNMPKYCPSKLPDFHRTSSNTEVYNLAAFEDWIASNLSLWIQDHRGDVDTCERLRELMKTYHFLAVRTYNGTPEAISNMLLTLLDIWIACDQSATYIHNMLLDYDPCIPIGHFQILLLPFRSQMKRLQKAEEYMRSRKSGTKYAGSGIFHDFGTPNCFSVRYFDQSRHHQNLRVKIEAHANEERNRKRSEFHEKLQKYQDLSRKYETSDCTCRGFNQNGRKLYRRARRNAACMRCEYQEHLASLSIDLHEWPLPEDVLKLKSTVFELDVPRTFQSWRDTTLFFLLDVLESKFSPSAQQQKNYFLSSYDPLTSFFNNDVEFQRIILSSEVKPHYKTHRRDKKVNDSITEDDILLKHAMHFKYYDKDTRLSICAFKFTNNALKPCVYQLPAASNPLQGFLFRSPENAHGKPPNEVITTQFACPDHMTLEEYRSLCAMPCGLDIQWQNILCQLAMPSVDLEKVETCIFILQIINQAGPSTKASFLRMGHHLFADETFPLVLLKKIREAAERIRENWKSAHGLCAMICLVLRVLSLSSSHAVLESGVTSLLHLRDIAFAWLKCTKDRETSNPPLDEQGTRTRRARTFHLSLICACTYDVEFDKLQDLLSEPSAAATFIQCSLFIQETDRALETEYDNDPIIPILYHRWQKLSYRARQILSTNIVIEKGMGLDIAIKNIWAAYPEGGTWSEDSGYWLVKQMAINRQSTQELSIRYSLLTGELLVNGLPLGRAPSEYESHISYQLLFGCFTPDLMPSPMPDMRFSLRQIYMRHVVHLDMLQFGMNTDLSVRAIEDDRTFELLPSRLFAGILPNSFVEDFVHWYDLEEKCVEFRPSKTPWASSSSNWRLRRCGHTTWLMEKEGDFLLSRGSRTAVAASQILSPIESPGNVHCISRSKLSALEIECPRLQLGFRLHQGKRTINCKQYRGMYIDPDQSFGTLVGLRSRLLLKNDGPKRLLLIPEGKHSFNKDRDHLTVSISQQSIAKCHSYVVDEHLRQLVDNGSLRSKLLLCYLHALTSFCLPDPFTGMTGTEQALTILRSAAVRSFDKLNCDDVAILQMVASLTPQRFYYPPHERVMQQVHWNEVLGFLAQHDDFHVQVAEIFQQDRNFKNMFYSETSTTSYSLPHVERDLLNRALIRGSTFRISEFGAEHHTRRSDQDYSSLENAYGSSGFLRAFTMSKKIFHQIPSTQHMSSEALHDHLWGILANSTPTFGPNTTIDPQKMKYDAGFILDPMGLIYEHWCGLHDFLCRRGHLLDRFQLMIWLSTVAFPSEDNMLTLETVSSLYTVYSMKNISPPKREKFQLQHGVNFNRSYLRTRLEPCLLPLERAPESRLHATPGETKFNFKIRQNSEFNENQKCRLNRLLNELEFLWPTELPCTPGHSVGDWLGEYINLSKVTQIAREVYAMWTSNGLFKDYLFEVTDLIAKEKSQSLETPLHYPPRASHHSPRKATFVTLEGILESTCPPRIEGTAPTLACLTHTVPAPRDASDRLAMLLDVLVSNATCRYEKEYIVQLRRSSESLNELSTASQLFSSDYEVVNALNKYLRACHEYMSSMYDALIALFTTRSDFEGTGDATFEVLSCVSRIGQWPRLSPTSLLRHLSRHKWRKLTDDWRRCFVEYACSIAAFQRANRLIQLTGKREDLIREIENCGHTNWDPMDFPETLLVEIENGILVREVQEQIAAEIRDMEPGKNAVMQLNMGEGKSSIIVPILCAALANSSCIVLTMVAKPQFRQMFQLLASRLGRLLDRRIYHFPVSRSLRLSKSQADELTEMCLECCRNGGILLVQPEHLLSLKLMGLESLMAGDIALGTSIFTTLQLFHTTSRSIIDESDENFSAKFELIYTMGTQRPIEYAPQRWILVQEILRVVQIVAPKVKAKFPRSIEVEQAQPGKFSRIWVHRQDALDELLLAVLRHVCDYGIYCLPVSRQPAHIREAILTYALKPELSPEEIVAVEDQVPEGFWTSSTKQPLLLLRGLVAGGVLAFCLGQKRWRVNYGPDTSRTPPTRLAVPYRAKDNPIPRSEFSHPDVVIVLTSLSFYYAGLSDDDLSLAFGHLLKSDQAEIEYQAWIQDAAEIPSAYCHLGGVNIEDHHRCVTEIYPLLRHSKGAIDYFLSHIVFPREMKEFPHKLSASGWDIGEVQSLSTGGFSGTNDTRAVLPLSVEQLDLPQQNHTNALVLEYLLRPENSVVFVPSRSETTTPDAEVLLNLIQAMSPPAQVVLDVGAQILELTNIQVATEWLKLLPDHEKSQAVVFFHDNDDLMVLDRSGRVEPLQISPFANQLELCSVFLDEAHTRGTDLKLPSYYRAAVTLGPGITKDKLVQACMRMRKLGKGQTVIFCIPDEIKFQIMELCCKDHETDIDVCDVLRWAICGTWKDLRRTIPLWATQGKRFDSQSIAINELREGINETSTRQASSFLEPESQSLDDRYRPRNGESSILLSHTEPSLASQEIMQRWDDFEITRVVSSQLQEEQERELAPEIEQERETQRPSQADPAAHSLHPDVTTFVRTGKLISGSTAYTSAFKTLSNTSASTHLDVSQFPTSLLVTNDFVNTVKIAVKSSHVSDESQRPVQWVLASKSTPDSNVLQHMLIISPYEANYLHTEVSQSKVVSMHIYAPRQSLSLSSLDDLGLFSIPRTVGHLHIPVSLRIQLNLFSGQLYVGSYQEYLEICDFLGVASEKTPVGLSVAADGFIVGGNQALKSTFRNSPLMFLRVFLSKIRKDSRDIDKTHIGKILNGQLLGPEDFESALLDNSRSE